MKTPRTDRARRAASYESRILEWMKGHPNGVSTVDLRSKFPRAQLRKMEKADKTIEYRDDMWHRV